MKFKYFFIFSFLLILIGLALGFCFSGVFSVMNVFIIDDGWLGPFSYSLWVSGIILTLFLGAILFPKIDPLKPNFKLFSKEYYLMVFSSQLFIIYFFVLDLFRANGFDLNIVSWLSLGFAVLFWFTAEFLLKVKRSWFLGFRTPWTMRSDFVFENTNQMGAKLLKIIAGFSVLGFLLGDSCLYFSVIPFAVVAIFLFFYSYSLNGQQRGR